MNEDNNYTSGNPEGGDSRYRDEVWSKRVPAGSRRTYYFDVRTTRSGEDFFVSITESKRLGDRRYEKHKIFLFKEDFAKFMRGLYEAMEHVRDERLPDFEYYGFPRVEFPPDER